MRGVLVGSCAGRCAQGETLSVDYHLFFLLVGLDRFGWIGFKEMGCKAHGQWNGLNPKSNFYFPGKQNLKFSLSVSHVSVLICMNWGLNVFSKMGFCYLLIISVVDAELLHFCWTFLVSIELLMPLHLRTSLDMSRQLHWISHAKC